MERAGPLALPAGGAVPHLVCGRCGLVSLRAAAAEDNPFLGLQVGFYKRCELVFVKWPVIGRSQAFTAGKSWRGGHLPWPRYSPRIVAKRFGADFYLKNLHSTIGQPSVRHIHAPGSGTDQQHVRLAIACSVRWWLMIGAGLF